MHHDYVEGKNNGFNKGGHKHKHMATLLGISDTSVKRIIDGYNNSLCSADDGVELLKAYTIVMREASNIAKTSEKSEMTFMDASVTKQTEVKKIMPIIETVVKQYIIKKEHTGIIMPIKDIAAMYNALNEISYHHMDEDPNPYKCTVDGLCDIFKKYVKCDEDGDVIPNYFTTERIDSNHQYEITTEEIAIVHQDDIFCSTVYKYNEMPPREGIM